MQGNVLDFIWEKFFVFFCKIFTPGTKRLDMWEMAIPILSRHLIWVIFMSLTTWVLKEKKLFTNLFCFWSTHWFLNQWFGVFQSYFAQFIWLYSYMRTAQVQEERNDHTPHNAPVALHLFRSSIYSSASQAWQCMLYWS